MSDEKKTFTASLQNDTLSNLYVYLLFIAAGLYMVVNLWSGSLLPCDEGAYGEIGRELFVEKKGLLTLYFNYQPWFEKPPLYRWLIAAAYQFYSVRREEDKERRAACTFIAGAVAVIFLLYKFVKTKVSTYIMPAYPLFALSMAVTTYSIVRNKERSDKRKLISWLLIILIIIPVGRFVLDRHKTLDYAPRLKALSLAAKSNSSKHGVLLLYQIPEFWEILFYSGRKINQVD